MIVYHGVKSGQELKARTCRQQLKQRPEGLLLGLQSATWLMQPKPMCPEMAPPTSISNQENALRHAHGPIWWRWLIPHLRFPLPKCVKLTTRINHCSSHQDGLTPLTLWANQLHLFSLFVQMFVCSDERPTRASSSQGCFWLKHWIQTTQTSAHIIMTYLWFHVKNGNFMNQGNSGH